MFFLGGGGRKGQPQMKNFKVAVGFGYAHRTERVMARKLAGGARLMISFSFVALGNGAQMVMGLKVMGKRRPPGCWIFYILSFNILIPLLPAYVGPQAEHPKVSCNQPAIDSVSLTGVPEEISKLLNT